VIIQIYFIYWVVTVQSSVDAQVKNRLKNYTVDYDTACCQVAWTNDWGLIWHPLDQPTACWLVQIDLAYKILLSDWSVQVLMIPDFNPQLWITQLGLCNVHGYFEPQMVTPVVTPVVTPLVIPDGDPRGDPSGDLRGDPSGDPRWWPH